MKNKRKVFIITIIVLLFSFLGYKIYQFTEYVNNISECWMDEGPVYGSPINSKLDKSKIEDTIDIPNCQVVGL